MKTTTAIFIMILMSFPYFVNAQVRDISMIDEQLTERPWLDKSKHEINGHEITQVFGERPAEQRHSNLGSITTLAYLDPAQTKEKYGKDSPGGSIELFVTRSTESRANFKWFFVVVRGADDQEKIMEIDLEYQAAQLPDANGWWNFTSVLLPESVGYPFYVYINDRQSQHLSDFKFMVNK